MAGRKRSTRPNESEAHPRIGRAIWKGSISFGLVNVPVELHTAVRDHRPRLRLPHRADASTVSYERICRKEGKAVAWEELVKGYEYEKGRFVVLTKEDFETAALERSRRIDILDFVDNGEIDDRYFDTSYYLSPTQGADRAYAVLRAALQKAHKVGVGRVMLRDVQHLAAVGAIDNALVLTLMRFADELIDPSTLTLPSQAADEREVGLAESIIDHLTRTWDPSRYTDEYRENLMRVIHAKLKGKQPQLLSPSASSSAEVVDLMTRLRQSLARARSAGSKRAVPAKALAHSKKRRSTAA